MTVAPIEHVSTIHCPHCGHRQAETMPADACWFLYDCRGCGALLRPRRGDCCVFCSYGDVPGPPVQLRRGERRPPVAAKPDYGRSVTGEWIRDV